MKVSLKHVREDCFAAREKGIRVYVAAHRNKVDIHVDRDGKEVIHYLISLEQFAELLSKAEIPSSKYE